MLNKADIKEYERRAKLYLKHSEPYKSYEYWRPDFRDGFFCLLDPPLYADSGEREYPDPEDPEEFSLEDLNYSDEQLVLKGKIAFAESELTFKERTEQSCLYHFNKAKKNLDDAILDIMEKNNFINKLKSELRSLDEDPTTMNQILRLIEKLRRKNEWNEYEFNRLLPFAFKISDGRPGAMSSFLGEAKKAWILKEI